VDKSLKNNEVIKLGMKRGGKYEAAWQRVVLNWGSKKDINQLTGASDGLIAQMRRVKAAALDRPFEVGGMEPFPGHCALA
jgi:hypothetical protein